MFIWLRLKLIADVGLIGKPNAGKSTLLTAVTKARPKIANYPFTTLHPHLGVAMVDGKEMLMADIPGLIEGASEGVGLGTKFLKHIERCSVFIHVIDGTEPDILQSYRTIRSELEKYSASLAQKPEIIALNKCDCLTDEDIENAKKELRKATSDAVYVISGIAGTGLKELLRAADVYVQTAQQEKDQNE